MFVDSNPVCSHFQKLPRGSFSPFSLYSPWGGAAIRYNASTQVLKGDSYLGLCRGYIGVLLGIMEKKVETTIGFREISVAS